jgi:hypothetical protein
MTVWPAYARTVAEARAPSTRAGFRRLTARFAADPERDPFEDWTLTVVLIRT